MINKRAHIISMVNKRSARYLKKKHKFGDQVPKSAKHALELDKQNGNTFWQDSIAKETKNERVSSQILDENEEVPIGYKFIRCHMIFDVKMEDFCGKHQCKPHTFMRYNTSIRNGCRCVSHMATSHKA